MIININNQLIVFRQDISEAILKVSIITVAQVQKKNVNNSMTKGKRRVHLEPPFWEGQVVHIRSAMVKLVVTKGSPL